MRNALRQELYLSCGANLRRVQGIGCKHLCRPRAFKLRVGDTISIQYPGRNRTFDVVKLAHRPFPAAQARELYIEHLPKLSPKSAAFLEVLQKLERQQRRERKGKGRLTKKERRQLEKIRGRF